ncbi:hypothetical protein PENTCL1PPCAC_27428 [Pristionchus entomophagus]|uniref:Uncharacterized protein n=1 Tax=Pristionchus entomophagus TaxID=358040 RepID=A0AAV5UE79_9BILA|nr:hypothetical protein PENTCL1PPCAC_27428 [Pristionchus entomophagus]
MEPNPSVKLDKYIGMFSDVAATVRSGQLSGESMEMRLQRLVVTEPDPLSTPYPVLIDSTFTFKQFLEMSLDLAKPMIEELGTREQ